MENEKVTSAKQDAEVRQALYKKSNDEKERIKVIKSTWKREQPKKK